MSELLKGLRGIAEAYGISERTAGALVRAGDIPAQKIGKSWRLLRVARDHQLLERMITEENRNAA